MLDFLTTNNHNVMFAISFGSIALLLIIESIKPRRKDTGQQLSRWSTNIGISLLNFFLIGYFAVFISSSSWLNSIQQFTPLLHFFEFNQFSQIIIIFVVFEFTTYWLHRLMHVVPVLWRIHAVHHCDTDMDVTTTHRHHFFEPLLSLTISLAIVIVLGPSIAVVIVANIFRTIMTSISHSNIVIPENIEKYLRYFIVTPDFHRLHHASLQKHTDSNYGAIFPWFDYLFGSATQIAFNKQETIELGLSYLRKTSDSRIDRLLLLPFVWKK
jgi:sterol desaturase/sphingolipid hydroxylase (fatty acid hydroxylase superfamily)